MEIKDLPNAPEWLKRANTINADVEMDSQGRIIWNNGTWNGGIWEGYLWKTGVWEKGIWRGGIWQSGVWVYGTWFEGIWESGTWRSGRWVNGTWKSGTWFSGEWLNGEWQSGFIRLSVTPSLPVAYNLDGKVSIGCMVKPVEAWDDIIAHGHDCLEFVDRDEYDDALTVDPDMEPDDFCEICNMQPETYKRFRLAFEIAKACIETHRKFEPWS